MSAEKIIYEVQDQAVLKTPVFSKIKFSGRVDINDLLARARIEENKKNKINLVCFGLSSALVIIIGIVFSF